MAENGNGGWGVVRWVRLVIGSVGAGIGNYLIITGAGVQGKLAILSGILGACSYAVAFIQNPSAPPALPEPPKKA